MLFNERGLFMAVLIALAAGVVWLPRGLNAQTTRLADLLSQADSTNPALAASRSRADAARARVLPAGALPDPMVGLGFMNVPVAHPSLSAEMMTMTTLQVGTTLPWPGKRRLRESGARLSAEAEVIEVDRVRNDLFAEISQQYYSLYFVDRAIDVLSRNEQLLQGFASLVVSRYEVGTGTQAAVLKAQVERARLADQALALQTQRLRIVAALNSLLGRPADTPVDETRISDQVMAASVVQPEASGGFVAGALSGLLPDEANAGGLPSLADLQRTAVAQNPMLLAHERRNAARGEAVALAEISSQPDITLSAAFSYRGGGRSDMLNLMVSAPIPLFAGRKQDQVLVEQSSTLLEEQAQHRSMTDRLMGEIASLRAELIQSRDRMTLFRATILPQARTGLSASMAAFQSGEADFLTLLDAQATLYRHELDYERLLTDFATKLALLERAIGTEILP